MGITLLAYSIATPDGWERLYDGGWIRTLVFRKLMNIGDVSALVAG